MNILALSAFSFSSSVRQAAGVEPLLFPPVTAQTFDPAVLANRDFIYIKLHGLEGQPFWYGDSWITAVTAEQIRQADLTGTAVFVANCFLPNSPMLDALLKAGAAYVVGGEGENFAGKTQVKGADILGREWLKYCRILPPDIAYTMAHNRLYIHRKTADIKDALQFKLYTGKTHEKN